MATAGIQYAKATSALIDVATDSMIDADSEALVRTKLPAAAVTGDMQKELQTRLGILNEGLTKNTKAFFLLRTSLSTIESYFTALQALSDNPQSDTTASSVAILSDRVNSLNGALTRMLHKLRGLSLVFCFVGKFSSVGRKNHYAAPSENSPTNQNPARSSREFMQHPG